MSPTKSVCASCETAQLHLQSTWRHAVITGQKLRPHFPSLFLVSTQSISRVDAIPPLPPPPSSWRARSVLRRPDSPSLASVHHATHPLMMLMRVETVAAAVPVQWQNLGSGNENGDDRPTDRRMLLSPLHPSLSLSLPLSPLPPLLCCEKQHHLSDSGLKRGKGKGHAAPQPGAERSLPRLPHHPSAE